MEDIKDRLNHILRSKNLTAKQFAELMEIQPSNVSHLLNGRNKPSIDFLMKLKEAFPEYSFDWIIMGKRPITINEPNPVSQDKEDVRFDDDYEDKTVKFEVVAEDNDKNISEMIENNGIELDVAKNANDIDKILIVYSDKTFEILKHRN